MYSCDRKKQRGQRRKLKALMTRIDSLRPFTNTEKEFEHFHVPCSMFIEHPKTSSKIKTAFSRKWIEAAEKMIREKPEDLPFCKIAAVINTPSYWSSQIIIFYDESYYNSFFKRSDSYQTWIRITDNEKSFMRKRNISSVLQETGYHEIINDDGSIYEDELWFYGEMPE